MQGRLSRPVEAARIQAFPSDSWEHEFETAARAGLSCIEWILDSTAQDLNPITTNSGVGRIRNAVRNSGVDVRSLVADVFMDHLLIAPSGGINSRNVDYLEWLLRRAEVAGIRRVVLPFVDASSLTSLAQRDSAKAVLATVLSVAEATGVEIHLEMDLAPTEFAAFLNSLQHPMIWVNYDSGNSASLGFDVRNEFSAYGHRIGSVHLKDRVRGGGTVPLGEGNANFGALFSLLGDREYGGDFILQVARGTPGEEFDWARVNISFFAPFFATLAERVCTSD